MGHCKYIWKHFFLSFGVQVFIAESKKTYWDLDCSAFCTDQDDVWMKPKKKRNAADLSAGNGHVGQMLGIVPPQDSPVQPPELVQDDRTSVTVQAATSEATVTPVQPVVPAAVTPVQPLAATSVQPPVVPAAAVTPVQPAAATSVQPHVLFSTPPCTPARAYHRAPGTPVHAPAAQSKAAARPPPHEDDPESDRSSLSSDLEEHMSANAEQHVPTPDPCPICLDAVKVGEEVTALPCAHVCHNECLAKWRASRPGGIPEHHCPLRCERTWQSSMQHVSEWTMVEAEEAAALEAEAEIDLFG